MDLRERLARLDPLARRPAADRGVPAAASARAAGACDRPAPAHRLSAIGLRFAGRTGEGLAIGERLVAGLQPPPWPPPDLRGMLPEGAAELSSWRDVLLLDTETTGLAGGTGTLAFMVGIGWWRRDGFIVRQYFLGGPQHERALLGAVARVAGRFRAVVTYNGAVFDLPLLRTRARLNRCADPLAGCGSWDLLAAIRRLWGRSLPDCRQQTVERAVCGMRRDGPEICGELIPGVYQAYLREVSLDGLPLVLAHNARDIEGLARLLGAVMARARAIAVGPPTEGASAPVVWSNALVCERRRQHGEAAAWAGFLVDQDLLAALPLRGVLDAVRLLKRAADWPRAVAAIKHGLARWPEHLRLHYEAAVLFEHRLALPRLAWPHARILADERRLARLRQRMARGGSAHE